MFLILVVNVEVFGVQDLEVEGLMPNLVLSKILRV